MHSAPDVVASTANYLKSHGWQRGQGWGPGEPNFAVIKEWNKAEVYAKTIALFAEKLDGGRTLKARRKIRAAECPVLARQTRAALKIKARSSAC